MPSLPRLPLPAELRDIPFTVAHALELGVGQGRMRGPDLQRPFRGIRVARTPEVTEDELGRWPPAEEPRRHDTNQDLRLRCAALLTAMPNAAHLSHLTAARLWPLPLPHVVTSEPIHVSVRPPGRPPRRPGVLGHEVTDPLAAVVVRAGFALVDPATLFCQLARVLSLPDLVAVGDALTHRPMYDDDWSDRPWVPLAVLVERVARFRGRGKRAAARAVGLVRPGAESRPETLLRLALIAAGLPEPELNVDIVADDGTFLGRADLVFRQWKVIVEYDGDHHRTDTNQFDRDVLRLEALAANGWCVVRIVSRSFFAHRAEAIARVARALAARGSSA